MIELIAIIIFLGSVFALGAILHKKLPILVEMPQVSEGQKKQNFILKLRDRCKKLPVVRDVCSGIFLQKTLSKIRVLTLKIESKTSSWLQKLRIKTQIEKKKENDGYWSEVKNEVKNRVDVHIESEIKKEVENKIANK